MATIEDVLKQYETLRAWCDGFWEKVRACHAAELRCRKGCYDCCRLEGVSALEAHYIASAWAAPAETGQGADAPGAGFCAFLDQGACLIYEARPIICRTHGLAITGKQLTGGAIDCCPSNFSPELLASLLNRNLILNVDEITDNLMRLNLAFCLLLGDRELAGQRIALADIRAGHL